MKRQKSCGLRLGKLVHQLPGVVTFAYNLRFRCTIARWKGITEKNNFRLARGSASISPLGPKSPKNVVYGLKTAPEVWNPKNCQGGKLFF
jgi:hypothetical protein